MVDRGQFFARELRVRGGFEPTNAADGKIASAFWIGAELPVGGAGAASRVHESAHGVLPLERAAAVQKGLLPVLPVLIASGVDELLVLGVGGFVAVEPEVLERDGLIRSFADGRWRRRGTSVARGPVPPRALT
jgi:hypothetical protein